MLKNILTVSLCFCSSCFLRWLLFQWFLLKSMIKKSKKVHHSQRLRSKFKTREIPNLCSLILSQCHFTINLEYLNFRLKRDCSFINTIKNRCLITDNSRAVNKSFKLSRMALKNQIDLGHLPGVFKAL